MDEVVFLLGKEGKAMSPIQGYLETIDQPIYDNHAGRRLFPCDSRYYHNLFLTLSINGKTKWESPAWRCADPATTMINQTAWLAMKSEEPADLVSVLRRPLTIPIELHHNEYFSMEVFFDRTWYEAWYDAPERLVVLLEGNLSVAGI